MRTLVCVGLLLAVGCRVVSEQRSAGTTTAAAQSEPAPALPDPPPPPDPFAKDYEKAAMLLRHWEGDPRQLELARALLMSIMAKDRNYAAAYAGLARVEAHAGAKGDNGYDPAALERAAKLATHAIKLAPNSFDAYLAAGWIATEQKEFNRARDALGVADGLSRNNPEVHLGQARLASAEANTSQMLNHAHEVLAKSKDPSQRATAYQFVADAYEGGGHNDAAEKAYRELIRLKPRSASAHASFARFLRRSGDLDGAVREGEESLRLTPSTWSRASLGSAYLARAELNWKQGRLDEAAIDVEKTIALSPDGADSWSAVGAFYERASRRAGDPALRERAINAYRRSLALDRTNADAGAALARMGAR